MPEPVREVEWIVDGGVLPNFGRRIKGHRKFLPESVARDCINKKWAKPVQEPKQKKTTQEAED